MDSKYKYQRSFLIFSQEDVGFKEGGEPMGHVKIEVRDGKGKLDCHVSNLREDSLKLDYVLYMMKTDENGIVPFDAGIIPLNRNKGELSLEFDPGNIGRTGLTIEDINVVAVLVQHKGKTLNEIICPLISYKGGKSDWRSKLKKILSEQQIRKEEKEKKDKDKVKKDIMSKEDKTDNASKEDKAGKAGNAGNVGKEFKEEIISKFDVSVDENVKSTDDTNLKDKNSDNNYEGIEVKIALDKKQNEQEAGTEDGLKEVKHPENDEQNIQFEQHKQSEQSGSDVNENPNTGIENTENKVLPGNHEIGKDNIGIDKKDCNTCSNCSPKTCENPEPGIADVKMVEEKLDKCFIKYDPFKTNRKDYKWWKVVSPVHLNNTLFQINIKVPVLFNPQVLMAHFKYRHLIVGIYDGDEGKQFIVCGIPSVYWVDEKPFANICRWAQLEGNDPKYGAFGYWLVYINPKNGKILTMN